MVKRGITYNQYSILRYGFTMVEILVVVAILGIVVTIVFFVLQGHIGTSENTKKITDLNVVAKALDVYYTNHQQYPPSGATSILPRECKSATASLRSAVRVHIDGHADFDWSQIIYGVDSMSNPQGYILGIRGLTEDAEQLDNDLDVGDTLRGGVITDRNAPSNLSSTAWRCDCGRPSADTSYCESNKAQGDIKHI